jgi:hypothetical protein
MTAFSASLINHTVLPSQLRDSSHHVSEAKCPPRPTHLTLLHRAQIIHYPGSDLAVSYSYSDHWRVIWAQKDPQEYWHPHRSDCRGTLTYAHTTSRTLPTYDMTLGSLTVATPEAGDFVEWLQPFTEKEACTTINVWFKMRRHACRCS